jgi:hypothetical protein
MSSTTLKHRYSFSGSDTKAFAYYNQSDNDGKMYRLESMHTLSCSVFEAKGRVRSLGFKSIKGFTRAVREISGTMIMLVIEDHPLRDLMENNPYNNSYYGGDKRSWSLDAHKTARGSSNSYRYGPSSSFFSENDSTRIPTTLPPFNIVLTYGTEIPIKSKKILQKPRSTGPSSEALLYYDSEDVGASGRLNNLKTTNSFQQASYYKTEYKVAAMELIDVEIFGEGIVNSVNDMVTEIQYQFVARDYKEFSLDKRTFAEMSNFEFNNFEKITYSKVDSEQWEEVRRKNLNLPPLVDGSKRVSEDGMSEFSITTDSFDGVYSDLQKKFFKQKKVADVSYKSYNSDIGFSSAERSGQRLPAYSGDGILDTGQHVLDLPNANEVRSMDLTTGQSMDNKEDSTTPISDTNRSGNTFFVEDDLYKKTNTYGEKSPSSINGLSQFPFISKKDSSGIVLSTVKRGNRGDYIYDTVRTKNGAMGTIYYYQKGYLFDYPNGSVVTSSIPSGWKTKYNGSTYLINDNGTVNKYTLNHVTGLWSKQ